MPSMTDTSLPRPTVRGLAKAVSATRPEDECLAGIPRKVWEPDRIVYHAPGQIEVHLTGRA